MKMINYEIIPTENFQEWGNTRGLKTLAAKTKYMILGFKRKIPNIGLYLYGSPLEKVKALQFVGAWFEERMTWAVHIDCKNVERCEKVLNAMRSLAGCEIMNGGLIGRCHY